MFFQICTGICYTFRLHHVIRDNLDNLNILRRNNKNSREQLVKKKYIGNRNKQAYNHIFKSMFNDILVTLCKTRTATDNDFQPLHIDRHTIDDALGVVDETTASQSLPLRFPTGPAHPAECSR